MEINKLMELVAKGSVAIPANKNYNLRSVKRAGRRFKDKDKC